jgi:hypothetical protein
VAEVHPTPSHAGKVGSFLQQSTAGLPNWAWLLVIAGGIAAAVIVPKFINKGTTASTTTPSASGLGLAIDPTTGLPYAVEGLVPSGGITTSTSAPPPPETQPTTTTTPPTTIPTTPSTPSLTKAETRSAWASEADLKGGNNLPLFKIPNVTANWDTSGSIPLNQDIQIGAATTGNYYGKQATFYPVTYQGQTGYILASDLAAAGSTGPRPIMAWPQNYTRSRHFRIA